MSRLPLALLATLPLLTACLGDAALLSAGSNPPVPLSPDGVSVTDPKTGRTVAVPLTQARRLTRSELDNTLAELLGDTTRTATQRLPQEISETPFDNDYTLQTASSALVESLEAVVGERTAAALANPTQRAALIPCIPSGAADAQCFSRFLVQFGRRALRRPVSDEEVARYAEKLLPLAQQAQRFDLAVELAIRTLLQHPEFLFRFEKGSPVEGASGIFRLGAHELASRLSFFLIGSTPPAWLLDLADEGKLSRPEELRAAGERLLALPAARAQLERFHELWFGTELLPHSAALSKDFKQEARALMDRVIFDERQDYMQLFLSDETYLTPSLATHYGLDAPPAPGGWVKYPTADRRGLFSQGYFLSIGVRFNDTSPTQRGIFVRERLFCQEVPPPPPEANVDTPPDEGACKSQQYAAHASVGSCAGCHRVLDPIGFGLERYDAAGKYREHEPDKPECPIQGEGEVLGVGKFNGPAQFANVMTGSSQFRSCVTRQLFRFAAGREELPEDEAYMDALGEAFDAGGQRMTELLLAYVTHPVFALRRE